MTPFLRYLDSFNRKERFFLIKAAMGESAFKLSKPFRVELENKFGLSVPANAFVAMDYHLDWIAASLFLARPGTDEEAVHRNAGPIASGIIRDVDLLVAFDDGNITNLLLIEAKATAAWSTTEMRPKVERLKQIFGPDGKNYPEVRPQFALTSPRQPEKLNTSFWPSWMTRDGASVWFPLPMPSERLVMTGCDDGGKSSKGRQYFRIDRKVYEQTP